jgi:cell division protein ZapA (FtsZ GTPase activity inhibitor)
MHKRVTIEILGHQYSIRTDGDEGYVQRIADYLNNKSREVMETTKTVTTLDVVIMAAINLTDELFQERAAKEALCRSVEEESRRLIHEIEAHVDTSDSKP